MASLHSTSPLELLEPETQILILCHISTAETLHSLIKASPRFYQVFKSRREYHLTQLAMHQCGHSSSAWNAITASNLSKPISISDANDFIERFCDDDGWKATIIPLDVSIPMIRLGRCVEWFIPDFARSSLLNLTHLNTLMALEKDDLVLQSRLSEVETSRIRRAFFRFELSRQICQQNLDYLDYRERPAQNRRFLLKYGLDGVEEITCVRDYIVRRLWAIFDQIEDYLVRGELAGQTLQAMRLLPDSKNWFGVHGKGDHDYFMEQMMFYGLSFLRDVFTADMERRAELVLSASSKSGLGYFNLLTTILYDIPKREDKQNRPMFPHSLYRVGSKFHDSIDEHSLGWRWIHTLWGPGYTSEKGPRDWSYIF